MNKTILEYLEGYFGGELNESISDDNIMEAFDDLLETADAVAEFMIQEKKIDEAFPRKATDDIHHQADMGGEVNTDRSNLDKSIDANNLNMDRRRKRNKYLDIHTAAEDKARADRKKPKSEPVMLKIPARASTKPKRETSMASKIRNLMTYVRVPY